MGVGVVWIAGASKFMHRSTVAGVSGFQLVAGENWWRMMMVCDGLL